jgi:L-serine dehydratase
MKMFRNVAELVELAESQGIPLSEVMVRQEVEVSGKSKEVVINQMKENLKVMEAAVERGISENVRSVSGLTGGDAVKLQD